MSIGGACRDNFAGVKHAITYVHLKLQTTMMQQFKHMHSYDKQCNMA